MSGVSVQEAAHHEEACPLQSRKSNFLAISCTLTLTPGSCSLIPANKQNFINATLPAMEDKMRKTIALLATALALLACPAGAEDWPTYMHDPERTGVSGESVSLPLHLQWVYKSRHAPQTAWPHENIKLNLESLRHFSLIN